MILIGDLRKGVAFKLDNLIFKVMNRMFLNFIFLCLISFYLSLVACSNRNLKINENYSCRESTFYSLDSISGNEHCVTELILRNRKLNKLPENLRTMIKLKSLDLAFNEIKELRFNNYHNSKIEYIDLSFNIIKGIDSNISNFRELKSLNLSYNQIDTLPDIICSLTKLESLYLTSNSLEYIPLCICELKKIKLLGISYNKESKQLNKKIYNQLKNCLPKTNIIYREIK